MDWGDAGIGGLGLLDDRSRGGCRLLLSVGGRERVRPHLECMAVWGAVILRGKVSVDAIKKSESSILLNSSSVDLD